jgi:hypothetical protein
VILFENLLHGALPNGPSASRGQLHVRVQHTPVSLPSQWCISYKTKEREEREKRKKMKAI